MKQADPDALRLVIADVVKASPLAIVFRDLTIEADKLDDENDFLRVQLYLDDPDTLRDEDVDALVSSIESAVTEYDDRFPSVRFSGP